MKRKLRNKEKGAPSHYKKLLPNVSGKLHIIHFCLSPHSVSFSYLIHECTKYAYLFSSPNLVKTAN